MVLTIENADNRLLEILNALNSYTTKPYKIIAPDGSELTGKWFRSEKRFKEDLTKGEVRFLQKSDSTWSVQFKQRLASRKKMRYILGENEFKSYSDDLDALDMSGVFSYPKTVYLIKYLSQLIEEGATIVDFFSGSATTAHAIMEANIERISDGGTPLKYILIQLPEDLEITAGNASGDAKAIAIRAINLLDSVNRPHFLDQIGIERIIRAAAKIREEHPDTTVDLGFRHFTLSEPSSETLDKLEKFEPESGLVVKNTVLQDFGVPTVLATWLVRDGYGFTAPVQSVDFAGYTGYYMDKHLYLINPELNNEAIAAITEKYETDGAFNPENVVLFGYSFLWSEIDSLKINLARMKDTEKNLRINFDIRY